MGKSKFLILLPLLVTFSSCNFNKTADVIVYGDCIYTSNSSGDFVEAFAVKNGKYIAVGSKDDVDKYKSENTKIYNTKFAMSGGIESHGHWILSEAFKLGLYINPYKDDGVTGKSFEEIIDDIKAYKDIHKEETKNGIYGYGVDVRVNPYPDIEMFDKAFPDTPVFISESSLHGAFVNSKCFELAGLLHEDKDNIIIERSKNGHPIGIAKDEACTYIRNKVFAELLDEDKYQEAVKNAAKSLNSYGYVISYDAWSNFDGTDAMYKAINAVDKKGELNFLFSSAYCIESFQKDKIDDMIDKTVELKKKYTSEHYKPCMLKLFADGIVEIGTAYLLNSYNFDENYYGTKVWDDETMTSIVNKANQKGIPVHIHTMGDAACKEAIDAFVDSYNHNGYIRNSIAHIALINENELDRIKQYNFGATCGANWSSQISQKEIELGKYYCDESVTRSLYSCKDFVTKGIKAALHTDNPCSPGNLDIFGYIQVLLNGYDHSKEINENTFPRSINNFISLKDAIDMFTINGAWMNNLENERGSIEVGKYADFIFADKNPFTEKNDDVWKVKLTNTFFEGKEVYKR